MKTASISRVSTAFIQRAVILLIVFAMCAGCNAAKATPTLAPTDTPVPTDTPAPTNTPLPTDTPVPTDTPTPMPTDTPIPTDTPDLAATEAVIATATAEAILVPILAKLEEVGVATDTGSLVYYQPDPLALYIDSPGTQYIDAFPDSPTVANFVISTDVTWEATGIAVCGLIFRSETDVIQGAQYQLLTLRFSGLPGWDIEHHKDGYYQNNIIGEVKFSDAMNLENNSTNNILLIAENEKFTVYFNGIRQGSFFDYSKQRLDGIFGLAASEDSGETTCTYANTWVWQLP